MEKVALTTSPGLTRLAVACEASIGGDPMPAARRPQATPEKQRAAGPRAAALVQGPCPKPLDGGGSLLGLTALGSLGGHRFSLRRHLVDVAPGRDTLFAPPPT